MTQHTPVPFRAEEYRDAFFKLKYWVVGADHTDENWQVIADNLDKDMAQFVVKACNEYGKLKAMWDRLCECVFDGWELHYDDFLNIGEETGLLVKEVYDPEGKHKGMNVGDVEPGDECYFNVYALTKAREGK